MSRKKSFQQWMQEVDSFISQMVCGLDSMDLRDQPYDLWYEDGVSSKTAANRAIKDEFGTLRF